MMPFSNKDVKIKFDNYPSGVKDKLLILRDMIFDVAKENDLEKITETLKWNEPSYVIKNGSTVRIDYKKSKTNHYSMYFNCKTKLIKTFRELFSDKFTFIGDREILFYEDEIIDVKALRYCILLSLTYQKRKHLQMLDE